MQSQGQAAHMHTLVVFAFEEIEFFYRGRVEITCETLRTYERVDQQVFTPWCLTP